jgi:hypothetical protein
MHRDADDGHEQFRDCLGGIDRSLVKAWFELDALIYDLMLGTGRSFRDGEPNSHERYEWQGGRRARKTGIGNTK